MVRLCKSICRKNKITYKQKISEQWLEKKTEEPKIETPLEKEKPKRKSNKKVVENITLKF